MNQLSQVPRTGQLSSLLGLKYPLYSAKQLAKVDNLTNAVYVVFRDGIYYVGSTTKSLGNRLFKTNRGQQINSWRNDAVAFALPGNLTRRQVEAFETSVLIAVGGKVSRFTLNSKWPVAEKFWTELGIDK